MTTKTCTGCNLSKPVESFYKNKARYDGFNNYCKSCDSARLKLLRLKNPEVFKASSNTWYSNNRDSVLKSRKTYAIENQDKRTALRQNRRAARIKRTPPWAKDIMRDYMKLVSKFSKALTKRTGIKQSIDHIVPLQGELVSGLHLPWNIQIISLSENSGKCNKFVPTVENFGGNR